MPDDYRQTWISPMRQPLLQPMSVALVTSSLAPEPPLLTTTKPILLIIPQAILPPTLMGTR